MERSTSKWKRPKIEEDQHQHPTEEDPRLMGLWLPAVHVSPEERRRNLIEARSRQREERDRQRREKQSRRTYYGSSGRTRRDSRENRREQPRRNRSRSRSPLERAHERKAPYRIVPIDEIIRKPEYESRPQVPPGEDNFCTSWLRRYGKNQGVKHITVKLEEEEEPTRDSKENIRKEHPVEDVNLSLRQFELDLRERSANQPIKEEEGLRRPRSSRRRSSSPKHTDAHRRPAHRREQEIKEEELERGEIGRKVLAMDGGMDEMEEKYTPGKRHAHPICDYAKKACEKEGLVFQLRNTNPSWDPNQPHPDSLRQCELDRRERRAGDSNQPIKEEEGLRRPSSSRRRSGSPKHTDAHRRPAQRREQEIKEEELERGEIGRKVPAMDGGMDDMEEKWTPGKRYAHPICDYAKKACEKEGLVFQLQDTNPSWEPTQPHPDYNWLRFDGNFRGNVTIDTIRDDLDRICLREMKKRWPAEVAKGPDVVYPYFIYHVPEGGHATYVRTYVSDDLNPIQIRSGAVILNMKNDENGPLQIGSNRLSAIEKAKELLDEFFLNMLGPVTTVTKKLRKSVQKIVQGRRLYLINEIERVTATTITVGDTKSGPCQKMTIEGTERNIERAIQKIKSISCKEVMELENIYEIRINSEGRRNLLYKNCELLKQIRDRGITCELDFELKDRFGTLFFYGDKRNGEFALRMINKRWLLSRDERLVPFRFDF